ncbi:hypothetical protein WN48_08484 [Eufriesea mexicana]|uniref:Uncharacterized protein n=1 Tax=Eufriesea mexicana TaxID=516756 RepID=A0A310SK28_9HYME|nr:hypothetical protein WN48_08484 [Eufriesea mexicana]
MSVRYCQRQFPQDFHVKGFSRISRFKQSSVKRKSIGRGACLRLCKTHGSPEVIDNWGSRVEDVWREFFLALGLAVSKELDRVGRSWTSQRGVKGVVNDYRWGVDKSSMRMDQCTIVMYVLEELACLSSRLIVDFEAVTRDFTTSCCHSWVKLSKFRSKTREQHSPQEFLKLECLLDVEDLEFSGLRWYKLLLRFLTSAGRSAIDLVRFCKTKIDQNSLEYLDQNEITTGTGGSPKIRATGNLTFVSIGIQPGVTPHQKVARIFSSEVIYQSWSFYHFKPELHRFRTRRKDNIWLVNILEMADSERGWLCVTVGVNPLKDQDCKHAEEVEEGILGPLAPSLLDLAPSNTERPGKIPSFDFCVFKSIPGNVAEHSRRAQKKRPRCLNTVTQVFHYVPKKGCTPNVVQPSQSVCNIQIVSNHRNKIVSRMVIKKEITCLIESWAKKKGRESCSDRRAETTMDKREPPLSSVGQVNGSSRLKRASGCYTLMNRGEQETLFRQSRQLTRIVPSHEDLVLSVLKSPISQHQQQQRQQYRPTHHSHEHHVNCQGHQNHKKCMHSGETNESLPRSKDQCSRLTEKRSNAAAAYAALQASEDELIAEHCLESEDAALNTPGSETEDTEDNGAQMEEATSSPNRRFTFLRRFRSPRFGEAHHKRVPTPMKRKYRRKKSKDDIIDNDMNAAEVEPSSLNQVDVPDPYYPIYLPIDQAFKAKYVFHHKKGKTFQERLYVFLEHPGGWICFIYHFTV